MAAPSCSSASDAKSKMEQMEQFAADMAVEEEDKEEEEEEDDEEEEEEDEEEGNTMCCSSDNLHVHMLEEEKWES